METHIDVERILRSKLKDKADKIPRFVVNYLIRIVHQEELNDILRRFNALQGVDFMEALVEDYFKVGLRIVHEENLPSEGRRCIFVSNHPLGGFDGICLSYFIGKRYHNNIKYFVNDLLLFIPNLRSLFVPINKHGLQSREAARMTEEAYRSDNQIITFPAGLCSRRRRGVVRDLEWKKSFVRKAVEYKRDVVPVFFEGRNSNFFYRLANIRKFFNIKMNLEMLYLPHELFKQRNGSFGIHIGKPVSWQTFSSDRKAEEWAAWVMDEVYKMEDK